MPWANLNRGQIVLVLGQLLSRKKGFCLRGKNLKIENDLERYFLHCSDVAAKWSHCYLPTFIPTYLPTYITYLCTVKLSMTFGEDETIHDNVKFFEKEKPQEIATK